MRAQTWQPSYLVYPQLGMCLLGKVLTTLSVSMSVIARESATVVRVCLEVINFSMKAHSQIQNSGIMGITMYVLNLPYKRSL